MRKLIAFGILASLAVAMSGAAQAGEVTGGPKHKATGMRGHAQSICGFSGQEDGLTLVGFTSTGMPIFEVVDWGPGTVQTPSHETSYGIRHEPGIPGDSCRGNLP
jgi:hypothetical protein